MRSDRRTHGFTLVELAIVLVLIGVMVGGGLVMITANMQASAYNVTVARMDAIDKAILNFVVANNRIPCPADLTQTVSSSPNYYGYEAGTTTGGVGTGECVTGMTPAANLKATSGTEEGGVPTRALQLADDYMYDGWGRKFRYAVDPLYTTLSYLPYPVGGSCIPSTSSITVNDSTETPRTTAGVYALMSHGANGHGAYTSAGVTLNAGSSSADELTNCHCTTGGVYNGTYTPTYVAKAPAYDSGQPGNAAYFYDDIVTFKEGWQLQAPDYTLGQASSTCIYINSGDGYMYVYDSVSYKFLRKFNINNYSGFSFDTSGNIWMGAWDDQITEYNRFTGAVENTPIWTGCSSGSFIDANNHVWDSDDCDQLVGKYNATTGAFMGQLGLSGALNGGGTASSGVGSFNNPGQVAIDGTGNIWVTDNGNNRLEQFNSSLAYVKSLGGGGLSTGACPSATTCVACTNTSSDNHCKSTAQCSTPCTSTVRCYCPGGTANGELIGPNSLAIDAGGNLWVADTTCAGGNNTTRIQEFSSTGTYIQTLPLTSTNIISCADQMNFDNNGNIWLADDWGMEAVEFSTSGTVMVWLTPDPNVQGTSAAVPYTSR